MQGYVTKSKTSTYTARYTVEPHQAGRATDTITINSKPPKKREYLQPRDGIAGGATIGDGSYIYVCMNSAPQQCLQYVPNSNAGQNAFKGTWWTENATSALLAPGAAATAAADRVILGITAKCYTANGGGTPVELCVDPGTGVVLHYRQGTPGDSGFTVTPLEFSATANDADFVPPYTIVT